MKEKPEKLHIHAANSGDYRLEDIIKEFGGETPTPKKSVSDSTMVFTPIKADAPPPIVGDEPVKVVHSTKDIQAKPMHTKVEPPIKIYEPSSPEPEKPVADRPQELLLKTHSNLKRLLVQRILLAVDMLLGLFFLLYHSKGWEFFPPFQRFRQQIPLLLLVLGLVLSYPVLWQGLRDLLRFRISLFTLGVCSAILCLIHSFTSSEISYAPLVVTQLFFLLQALVSENAAYFYTAKSLRSFKSPMGVCNAPQLLENSDSLRRNPGDMDDFMEQLPKSSLPQDLLCVYATVLLPLLPVLSYFLSRSCELPFVQVWLLLLLGTLPYAGMLSFPKPFRVLAKRLGNYGGALCGWHGAQIFGGKHTIILRDGDLFPRKGISSNGMKLYGSHEASRVISYALAALEKAESPLVDLFETLLQQQYGKHSRVSEHRFYDQGGIGVEIGSDIVLVGTLSFMRSMGVHMPAGTRVRQAVYVSINGELAGIFAIRYKSNASTRTGLHDVLANRNFSIVLATRDFLITPELIAAKYMTPTDTMLFPDYKERLRLSATNPEQAMSQGALIAEDTFGAFAVTAAAGRTLRNTSLASAALSLCAGILGLLMCILLIAWDAVAVASPMHIATFQLLWAFVTAFTGLILLRF